MIGPCLDHFVSVRQLVLMYKVYCGDDVHLHDILYHFMSLEVLCAINLLL